MRALLALSLLLAAAVAPPADARPPCPPDACCGGPLHCLTYAVEFLLDQVALLDVCHVGDDGSSVCVSLDPRSECRVHEADAAGWRCVL